MPRQPRIEFEGAIYHFLSRGDRREDIVRDDEDRRHFVQTLGAACARCDWHVHAWVLKSNHFHHVAETPLGNLSAGMKWFLGTYTMRFNRRHRLSGHLFAGRYKSLLIDDESPDYLRAACDYVHLNPARAGMIGRLQPLESYAWSSYGEYLAPAATRPGWLRVDRLLGAHGVARDRRRGRLEFGRRCEALRHAPDAAGHDELRHGWRLGAEDFVARLLDRLEGRLEKGSHRARERIESGAAKAGRIIAESLSGLGWCEEDLRLRGKCVPEKIVIAERLRAHTTLTLRSAQGAVSGDPTD